MTRDVQSIAVPAPSGVKCLIVDDRDENLLALSALLRCDDVQVLEARSGTEALELLLRHDVALAFLDVQMPEMDGFELAEVMRGSERTRHVPIIFVTAGTHDQQRVFKGYESGAVDFLFKPIEPHVLKSKAQVFFQLYRQQQQLALQLQERSETLRLNEMFTAVLGHDLRSPVSAILMSAQLLARRPEEEIRKIGARLTRSTRWMQRMIEDMLDLTRSRLGEGIRLRRKRVDLAALVGGIVEEQREAFPQRAIELHASGDLVGDWDPDRLTQVAFNLLGNALHHGDPATPVQARLDGTDADQVRLCVSNAGVIPDELLPLLFDPFRGRQQASRSGGLGLGLYIVQQIVHAHQGSVQAHSVDGSTRFEVELPRGIVEIVRL